MSPSHFFALSPSVAEGNTAYRESVVNQARLLGFTPIFLDECPPENGAEWVCDSLAKSQFAFFDLTLEHPDVLIALGLALESDATCFCLKNPDMQQAFSLGSRLLPPVTEYYLPETFGVKIRQRMEDVQGAAALNRQQLIERIKQKLQKYGPLPMREIANALGRRPEEIRFTVYAMVQDAQLTKEGDKRWARYRIP